MAMSGSGSGSGSKSSSGGSGSESGEENEKSKKRASGNRGSGAAAGGRKKRRDQNEFSSDVVRPALNGKQQQQKQQQENEKRDQKMDEMFRRVIQLESLVSSQAVHIRKLREENKKLTDATDNFGMIIEALKQAGLQTDESSTSTSSSSSSSPPPSPSSSKLDSKTPGGSVSRSTKGKSGDKSSIKSNSGAGSNTNTGGPGAVEFEYFDDVESEIFGSAPSSVTDAADAAGASILAALLAGKHRMLVDVRDAELSRDPDMLVQFIELAILPVAAGLEGLSTEKNRVKIVFPTVSQLMQYRRTMALAAPEVVALSTLGFDPVEERDNLVVVLAPPPDDEQGLIQMNDFLESASMQQPIVVLNHHMVPLIGPGSLFETIYHLRLLSVQYMAGDTSPAMQNSTSTEKEEAAASAVNSTKLEESPSSEKEDAALAAAMEHAHEIGIHQGVTRAMVIRSYPRPWHVFVDTSPDTDADFEVAATFDECPSQEDVNYAIVECLEGSEREDELVAQQMQEAIESGQLNPASDVLGLSIDKKIGVVDDEDVDDDDEEFDDDWNTFFGTDTV